MADDKTAEFFEALRRSSAKQLRLDPDNLSAAEATRVDRVSALRVCLDRMQTQQLATGEFDARNYIAASQELEKLLGGDPRQRHIYASSEARNKLKALFETALADGAVGDDAAASGPPPQREEASEPPPPVAEAELLPEGTEPPTSTARVEYIDNDVVNDIDEPEPSPLRTSSMNNAAVRPRAPARQPTSLTTQSFFGNVPGSTDLGRNPWATKDWSPRRGF